jgi:predicted nucleic acid-binding protein
MLSRDGVRFDWDVFRCLVNRSVDPAHDAVDSLRTALSVVRGQPWVDLPAGRYSWLTHDRIERDPVVAVVAGARRLAAMCAEAGNAEGAREALLRGLVVAPADEDLWRDALRLAARLGSRSDVKAVADSMYAAIAAHGSPLGPTAETDELVEELLPGYRRSAA